MFLRPAIPSAMAAASEYFEVVVPTDAPEGYTSVPTGIGVLKKNTGLTAAIKAAVESLVADGTYAELLKKWNLSAFAVSQVTVNGK